MPHSPADLHLDELRENVQRALEVQGVLAEMRARLRAAVISAIMDGSAGGHSSVPTDGAGATVTTSVGKRICDERAGPFALELLREFLSFYGLHQTLCVFVPESATPNTPMDRAALARRVGLLTDADEGDGGAATMPRDKPLLLALIEAHTDGSDGSARGAASSASRAASSPLAAKIGRADYGGELGAAPRRFHELSEGVRRDEEGVRRRRRRRRKR